MEFMMAVLVLLMLLVLAAFTFVQKQVDVVRLTRTRAHVRLFNVKTRVGR